MYVRKSHQLFSGYRGYKRNSDGTRILAVENGEHSLYDIIEEIREMQLDENLLHGYSYFSNTPTSNDSHC